MVWIFGDVLYVVCGLVGVIFYVVLVEFDVVFDLFMCCCMLGVLLLLCELLLKVVSFLNLYDVDGL